MINFFLSLSLEIVWSMQTKIDNIPLQRLLSKQICFLLPNEWQMICIIGRLATILT